MYPDSTYMYYSYIDIIHYYNNNNIYVYIYKEIEVICKALFYVPTYFCRIKFNFSFK